MKARRIATYISEKKNTRFGRILVFTGARQTGKTTLVRKVFPEYTYISIEDPNTRGDYAKLTAAQWRLLYPLAALDEVQKEPSLIESIKSVYDQWDEPRYVLLGSSQLLLMRQIKESLAGRCLVVDLFPLTLPELSTNDWDDVVDDSLFQAMLFHPKEEVAYFPSFLLDPLMPEKQRSWEHLLKFGGYPALTDETLSDEDRFTWLSNYVRTYLERDVRDLASFHDLEPFLKLQRALAIQTGNLINAAGLGTHIGMTSKTVQRYIQYLEMSYQTITLPAWERNQTKRLTKAPKIHYLDNGVLQAVLQKRGGITGSEFESLVIAELYKQAKAVFGPVQFHHLRTMDGKEVDLLVEIPDGYFAFEIKMSDRVTKNDARHLKNLAEMLDKPLLKSFILSNDPSTQYFSNDIIALHAAMFLG